MNQKIKNLLENKEENHIFPFFWQHGEEEAVLREYMRIIQESNIGAVCVESRPHPDFCGPGWWHDMDIILDEAKTRGMKVWILDDSHFPTGYCNGEIEKKPISFRRQFLTYRMLGEVCGGRRYTWETGQYRSLSVIQPTWVEKYFHLTFETFEDDQWMGVVAVKKNGIGEEHLLLLREEGESISFDAPEGTWKIYSCFLTHNRGPHRNYMNMLDQESCRTLLDAVYEPHFHHYGEEFGKTIAGFFSDEPEIGNGHLYEMDRKIYEYDDQPWSRELEGNLREAWGEEYVRYLPLLWEKEFECGMTARIRHSFMDYVTRLVEKNFSMQVGEWCKSHGVEYIGHLIEDNNQHARCGSSLGHYFRGLAGQDMAGIDDIGGQVLPQGEDIEYTSHLGTKRDGVFYHFALGRLASSAAAIEPRKKGRSMCEIFGNYGWQEGVRLEAFLADHFMVRGVNHFVPHAFSPKTFPDPDCPPHFYAHGNNPQYRHFGLLMKYMNRVCTLISGGIHESEAAILYHSDAEWTGMKCMYIQEPARILTEHQIGFDFIPSDVFTDTRYQTDLTDGFRVNRQRYRVLILPEADFITKETAQAVIQLSNKRFPCIFLNSYPSGICNEADRDREEQMLKQLRNSAERVVLDALAGILEKRDVGSVRISPHGSYIRSLLYHGEADILYMVNEGKEIYEGEVHVRTPYQTCCRYDAWENRLEGVDAHVAKDGVAIRTTVEPGKSFIAILGQEELRSQTEMNGIRKRGMLDDKMSMEASRRELNGLWERTVCKSKEYPTFVNKKQVFLPDHVEKEIPDFSGYVRYVAWVNVEQVRDCLLEITDAGEVVQVFINDIDMGIQIVPPYRYTISRALMRGRNRIVIETATTLERQIPPKNRTPEWKPQNACGLCGRVYLTI